MHRPVVVSRFLLTLICLMSFGALSHAALPEFTGLIEKNAPAVVKITTAQTVPGRQMSPFDQFRDLPEPYRHLFPSPDSRERLARSMGSGFVISDDGYIITNNHVIDGAEEINVRLFDDREFVADVIGTDPLSDLALLKIEASDLPSLRFAKPGSLKVGQWVLAIGSPFGLDYSASAGIVSAMGRSIQSNRSQYVPFIQTDVAINPGNSGGPLFNLDGEVVGINSQIYSRSGGSNGLSFSIPSEVAEDVISQLMDSGSVQRGWLGVVITDVSRDLAISFGLDKPIGALVNSVEPDSPADRAGIKPSDIIVGFNGREVSESRMLPQLVGGVAPGTEVEMALMRRGEKQQLTLTLGERASEETGVREREQKTTHLTQDRLGLRVEAVGERQRQGMNIDGGVLVRQVEPNSAAAQTGLRPGDVIVQLGYDDVGSLSQYQDVIDQLPAGKLLPIRFLRQGQSLIRTIKIEQDE